MAYEPGKKRRRLIGMGFVLAFVLSTATIIYTGLNVRAPGSARTESSALETPDTDVEEFAEEARDTGEAEPDTPAP
jgi:hypothetical protein